MSLFDLLPDEERAKCEPPVLAHEQETSKRDIFHHIYAMLHHPVYRDRYTENLKRDIPRIPILKTPEVFQASAAIGGRLMDLHIYYETMPEYPLRQVRTASEVSYHVEKMHFSSVARNLVVNETLTIASIPPECHEYRLGDRSALEWIVDQYQITTDPRSGIVSDPNNPDDAAYIVRLIGQIVYISVETVRLIHELEHRVSPDEWLDKYIDNVEVTR